MQDTNNMKIHCLDVAFDRIFQFPFTDASRNNVLTHPEIRSLLLRRKKVIQF